MIQFHMNKHNINGKEQLENLEFENLKMLSESVFIFAFSAKNDKAAKVQKLTIYEGAESNITKFNIISNVDIELNAVILLTKVDMKSVSQMKIVYSKSSQYRIP